MLAGYRDFDSCAEGVERGDYLAPCHLEKSSEIHVYKILRSHETSIHSICIDTQQRNLLT
jgi:hypothetical protein